MVIFEHRQLTAKLKQEYADVFNLLISWIKKCLMKFLQMKKGLTTPFFRKRQPCYTKRLATSMVSTYYI